MARFAAGGFSIRTDGAHACRELPAVRIDMATGASQILEVVGSGLSAAGQDLRLMTLNTRDGHVSTH